MIRIEALYFYPIKSCAGISTDHLPLQEEGALFDREWMIVDASGKFLTQREEPRLGQIIPSITKQSLQIRVLDRTVDIPLSMNGVVKKVQIWKDQADAIDQGDEIAEAIESFLGKSYRLVRCKKRVSGADKISLKFPDAFPLHLCSLSSLGDLNKRCGQDLEMIRFRPNIVISGTEAWAEDKWSALQFGDISLTPKKACTRCVITTLDPVTQKKGIEPLKTLAGFRKNAKNQVEFGRYLMSDAGKILRVGMTAKIPKLAYLSE